MNKRLDTIVEMTPIGSNSIDVGCDHAYVAIELAKRGGKVIASDIGDGPIEVAKSNIKKAKLSNIKAIKADGLDAVEDYINNVIISGMGGLNIIGIFERKKEIFKQLDNIIISPNNYQDKCRRYFVKNGFIIDDERLVKSGKYIYEIIKFTKGKKKYNDMEYYLGPILINDSNKDEYFTRKLIENKLILKLLPKNGYLLKKFKIKKYIKYLEKALKK